MRRGPQGRQDPGRRVHALTSRGWPAALLLAWACLLAGCAQTGLVRDRDYAVIDPPQPVTQSPVAGSVEVIEFIWFGCPHCADMHPRLQAWLREPPAPVHLIQRPAVFRDSWRAAAQLHHTLEAMGELPGRTAAVFEAVQLDELNLNDEAALLDWVARQGLDRERFLAAQRSPAVQARTERSAAETRAYQLRGVPAFVVDGRYLTSNGFTGSADDTLRVLSLLVLKARDERAARR